MMPSASSHQCHHCGVESATSRCGGCRLVWYCSKKCQRLDWKKHKSSCRSQQQTNHHQTTPPTNNAVTATSPADSSSSSAEGPTAAAAAAEKRVDGRSRPSCSSDRFLVQSSGATTTSFSCTDNPTISFLTYGVETTGSNPVWQHHYETASIEAARELPQVVLQAWHFKVVRYWFQQGRNNEPGRDVVSWYLELLNVAPMMRNETEHQLLLYREAWDDNYIPSVDRLMKILLAAMSEGGNLAARQSILEAHDVERLQVNHPDYFVPRRPGLIALDRKLECHLSAFREAIRRPLNMQTWLFGSDQKMDGDLKSLFETPGNTMLEPAVGRRQNGGQGGVHIRYLSKQERKEFLEQADDFRKGLAEEPDLYPPPDELLEEKPRWEWEEYESLEEAMDELGVDGESDSQDREKLRKELTEVKAGWEAYYEGSTLEEVCMQEYDAKSVEEAIWDYVGVPRLWCRDENAGDQFNAAGWRYQGYKAGKDYAVSEESTKYGNRLVIDGSGFSAWSEGRQ